jgi:hypothetical protein
MTDIEICQRDMLYFFDATDRGVTRLAGSEPGYLKRILAMTIEIIHLTTQIQRWLNAQVARHLEAQAARLGPLKS